MNLEQLVKIAQANCLLTLDSPILVGVSGGSDSLCLMSGLARIHYPLVVAHFDHQLRRESTLDAALVEAAAARLGLPFILGSQNVAAFAAQERLSIEEAARVLRYRFLFQQAREHHAQAVAVGHTADDQVETVMMHLLRGAGLPGLKGMAYRSRIYEWDAEIPLVRPLLPFWRSETVEYCREQGYVPVQDASNQDLSFMRNRIRRELIPYLESYNPQIRRTLWRTSQVLAGDDAVVHQAAGAAWETCFVSQSADTVELNLERLQDMSSGLLHAVLRRAVNVLLPALRDVDYAAIERAEDFLENPTSRQIELVRGVRLSSEGTRLILSGSGFSLPNPRWPQVDIEQEQSLQIPGTLDLPGGWRLASRWVEAQDLPDFAKSEDSPWEAWLDAGHIPGVPGLRRPHAGDRFQPLGMGGHSLKLSDFWINQKHPRRARAGWPLIVSGAQILWVPGFRLADPVRIQTNTRRALHLRLFRVFDVDEAV